MVFLRYKIVKGEKYFYLVKSVWDSNRNTSRQETIKYLGKLSDFTKNDIPLEYRNDPKIIAYLSSDETISLAQKANLLSKIKTQMYHHLIGGDFDRVWKTYNEYSSKVGFVSFFESVLRPAMYRIGEMWERKEISIADEHIASNVASMLVKAVQKKDSRPATKKRVVICVPEGEQHNLGASIIEAHLARSGFEVYNLTPSEPHRSILDFIKSKKPDVVIVSVTLHENIKPAHRLVKKITQESKAVVFVGGQALDQNEKFDDATVLRDDLKNLPKIISKGRV